MNKMYKVRWENEALEMLEKLDKTIAKLIYDKVNSHLVKAPKDLGKPLQHNRQGYYRYRVKNDYRVIYKIIEDEVLIVIFEAGHRKDIYRD